MDNSFYKPYLKSGKTMYFPYSSNKLIERAIFPTYVFGGVKGFIAPDAPTVDEVYFDGKLVLLR